MDSSCFKTGTVHNEISGRSWWEKEIQWLLIKMFMVKKIKKNDKVQLQSQHILSVIKILQTCLVYNTKWQTHLIFSGNCEIWDWKESFSYSIWAQSEIKIEFRNKLQINTRITMTSFISNYQSVS